jgi:hypothetical protein
MVNLVPEVRKKAFRELFSLQLKRVAEESAAASPLPSCAVDRWE